MSVKVTVGHSVQTGIVYLDQNGNPMLGPVIPDSPPTWSHSPSTSGIDELKPDADGNAATLSTFVQGTDVIGVTVTVGGKSFSASLGVEIDPAPQVLTSVEIAATVQ